VVFALIFATNIMTRLDLTRTPGRTTCCAAAGRSSCCAPFTLAGFIFTILAGIFGSVVGKPQLRHHFRLDRLVDGAQAVLYPLWGRSWCSICPIPMPGEWLQHGGFCNPAAARAMA